jgi:hypothetical protein
LLEILKNNQKDFILVNDLIIEMICEVWYPINYFKLSFGKQDKFENSIKEVIKVLGCQKDLSKDELKQLLHANKNEPTIKMLINDLCRYVPYRFVTPWFVNELKGELDSKKNNLIQSLSKLDNYRCLYKFKSSIEIEINPIWKDYLFKNCNILKGYTLWHLVNYLQNNNPNVPNISDKLFAPQIRILKNAKKFWEVYLRKKKKIRCIYSSELVSIDNFSIDHFIPWSFVAHDQLWNLLPVTKSVNSSKGDKLPGENYFEKFYELQFDAIHVVFENGALKENSLEDYSILFKDTISNILELDLFTFKKGIDNNIKPMIQIATNMGFSNNWIYKQ